MEQTIGVKEVYIAVVEKCLDVAKGRGYFSVILKCELCAAGICKLCVVALCVDKAVAPYGVAAVFVCLLLGVGHDSLAFGEGHYIVILKGYDSFAALVDKAPLAVLLYGGETVGKSACVFILGSDDLRVDHLTLIFRKNRSNEGESCNECQNKRYRSLHFSSSFQVIFVHISLNMCLQLY